jgi:hemolysin-activating ACP:hemolysin acyltransferase
MLMNDTATNDLSEVANPIGRGSEIQPQSKRVVMNQPMSLAQIIMLMLQSSSHRHFSLSDLEWMVLPPLRLGQVAVAESKPDQSGSRQPLAVLFWATVSAEVDGRICSNLSAPLRLRPDEWRSGDILWIADMIGDMSVGHALVKNLIETALAGRTVRVRSLDSEGKPILLEVGASSVTVVGTSAPETCDHAGPSTGTVCASCVTTGCSGRCRKGNGESSNSVSH